MTYFDYGLVAVVVLLAAGAIYALVKYPKKAKTWLVWACAKAEKEMGSKTGQLKLKYVYDLFIKQYPVFSTFVSFDTFSKWVDIALKELEKILEEKANEVYVKGTDK